MDQTSSVAQALVRASWLADWEPQDLTPTERACVVLAQEVYRLNVGIVDALGTSPIDRDYLIELLYGKKEPH